MTETLPEPPSVAPNATGFWSRRKINDRLNTWRGAQHPLIHPDPAEGHIGKASVWLTVGDEIYISPASDADPKTRQILKKRESCVIPSGQFAFLSTAETVRVPADAIAFITLRSKETSFRGLVNVSGFHVDPGYHGKLIFSVFNAGPGPVQITCGEPWFEIFFADLAEPDPHVDRPNGYKGIPTGLITPLARQFHSFAGLETQIKDNKEELVERINALEREHAVVRWAAVLIAGALLTLALRAVWTGDDNKGPGSSPAHNAAPAAPSPAGATGANPPSNPSAAGGADGTGK